MGDVAAPYVLQADEGRWRAEVMPGLSHALLARSEDTAGRLSLMRMDVPPGVGPPLHRHPDLDEAMFVLEGTVVVRLGDVEHELGPGGFAWMPRGVPHAFANVGQDTARWLGVISPPGRMEEFFQAVHSELANHDGPPDPELLMELNARHGIEVLGPPLRSPQPS